MARARIVELAAKAEQAADGLRSGFPSEPDTARTARHPYYGELNAFGWLLTVPNQLGVEYNAHAVESILKYVAPELGWR